MKKIALTFDDGPNTIVTPLVLDLVEQYNIKATFFLNGKNINKESIEVMKRARRLGCDLENHSFNHPAMPELSDEEILAEINNTTKLIEDNSDAKVKYFRPPYIAYNQKMADLIDYTFICGLGCDDWDENVSVETRIEKIMDFTEDGVIILLHDSDYNFNTVEALKTVIPALLEKGFEFVTVDELFKAKQVEGEVHTAKIYSQL